MTTIASTDLPRRLLLRGGAVHAASDGRTYPDVSPVTGAPYAEIAAATVQDATAAVATAAAAQPHWAATPIGERRRILLAAADSLQAGHLQHRDTFALETGSVRGWADMNVTEAAETLREAAALVSAPIGAILPSHHQDTVNYSRAVPAGVVLAVVPWNAPLVLAARSTAIALAVGNAVVIKPSEEAPITAGHLLADALHAAGLPGGVLNVVTTAPGEGRDVINTMIADPAVRRVVFIGSTPVGRAIAAYAGRHLTPCVLELGGKNTTIIRADADLEAWTRPLAFASFANTGQVCMCTDRIIVHASRAEELTERLGAAAKAMVVGDPRDEATELGPLINAKAADTFRTLVLDALAHGARLVAGGPDLDGQYARPTVLTGVDSRCALYAQEAFSPLVSIHPADDDEAAVALANDTDFGLIAGVVSADAAAAERMSMRLRTGAVHINGPTVGDEPHVPFGGLGMSGFGRLGGLESVRAFTDQRTFYVHGGQ
ncbi:aldehyde dehydrogenase family protein [Streptomyces griseoaurantiacus]|uniref:aldehyde dehydrogenase family protein n=1 Tax=Streptomyces griseoaurantiacus TaxID=68213 RepID=UPI0037ABB9F8